MRQHSFSFAARSMQAAANVASNSDSMSGVSHRPLYQRYSQVQSSPLPFGEGGEGSSVGGSGGGGGGSGGYGISCEPVDEEAAEEAEEEEEEEAEEEADQKEGAADDAPAPRVLNL